ncbi:unnamed protein product, partial [Coregonus sp. 'balchen']
GKEERKGGTGWKDGAIIEKKKPNLRCREWRVAERCGESESVISTSDHVECIYASIRVRGDTGDVCVRASISVCEDSEGDVCVSGGDNGRARCGGGNPSQRGSCGEGCRERLGTQSTVNILLPSDISELFRSEGLHPRRMTLQPWATHRETQQHSKGVFLKNGAEWRSDRLLLNREVMMAPAVRRFLPLLDEVARDFCRMLATRVEKERGGEEGRCSLTFDPSPDLFRFALEVERMLATTPPLLYLPPRLLWRLGASLWTQHATAWDHIFSHAETRIQRGVQRLRSTQAAGGGSGGKEGEFTGILGQLMDKGQLSLELIRANITELMAGGVDTTAVPLQFALYELGRNPAVQEQVRGQVRAAWARAGGDAHMALQGAPLLKGLIKETLRLYPVGITVQRYPVRDIVIQNYHIPAGESGEGAGRGGGFRSLAFGFGARQCVGRRIAENEMQLLLMHILLSFRLSVSSSEELSTKYTLILQPETPPRITFSTL